MGDDKTDEDLFKVLPEEAISIKIGLSASLAKYNLKNQQEVAGLMNKLLEANGGRSSVPPASALSRWPPP